MKAIIKRLSHIAITDYEPGECPELEQVFTYVEAFQSFKCGMLYDEKTRELRIFGGASIPHIRYITNLPVYVDNTCDETKRVSVRLLNIPRNELQREMIKFLTANGDYANNANCSQLSCNAETGEGKTFCAIASITYIRYKPIIILNRINIKDTWLEEITKFTDFDHKRILELNSRNIKKILKGKLNPEKYDLFIAIHRTISNIGSELGWETVGELFKLCKIGLKIYDEAHREFTNTTYIDCYTNTLKTIYLTATLKVSGRWHNNIFQRVFISIPKFNQRDLGYNDSKKHIVMVPQFYNSHPDIQDIASCKTIRGFSATAHSSYQVERDKDFFEILVDDIRQMSINRNFRTLILTAKITSCKAIADYLKDIFRTVKIGVYNSDINETEKARVLREDHIIVSTSKSLGESKTISDLRVVINCEAFFTDTIGDQASGRLRRLGPDTKCFYIELLDFGFKNIRRQWPARKRHYEDIFYSIHPMHLDGEDDCRI